MIKLLLRQLLALFVGGISPLLAADSAATVTEAVNQVTHGSSQTAASAPATQGTRLQDGEYLKTGVKSRAELELANLSVTRLGANTIFNYSSTTNEIDLQSGTVLFSKPKDGSPMTIKTASVTAAVVGTSGFAQMHGKGFLFGLIEGHATLTIGADPITISAGQIMRMGADGQPQVFYFNIPLFLATSPLITKFHTPLPNQAYIDKEVAKYKVFASRGFIGPPSQEFILSDFDGSVPVVPFQGQDSAGKALDVYNFLNMPYSSNGPLVDNRNSFLNLGLNDMKQQSHFLCLGLAVSLTLAGSSLLLAQSPAAETVQQKVGLPMQTTTPTPTTSSDADLGEIDVVQRFPKPEMFTFSTSQDFFYTDNVFYANAAPIASLAYLGSYTASFVPYSLRDWTPRITFQYNMVRYDSAAAGDFDNENLAFSNQYVFSDDRAWTWTATINLSRYTAPHANDAQFYKEVVYDNQISHVQQLLKETPLFFIASYDLAYHQANPGAFDRLDNGLSFSLAYYPISQVSVNFYVRPAERMYFTNVTGVQQDRNDFNLSEGFDVTWQPCKYAAISADFSHTDDYSSNTGTSYSDTSPGVALTGTYKF